jgi:hypothetical protein
VIETTRWAALLQATGQARVVAAGDAAQLSPIGLGGLWPVLTDRVPTALLTTVYRADSPWAKDAWAALRAGAARRGALRLRPARPGPSGRGLGGGQGRRDSPLGP